MTKLEPMARRAALRFCMAAAALLQVACGETEETPDFCRNAWTEVRIPASMAQTSGRNWHASTWTGTSLLTWGGYQAPVQAVSFEPPASFSALPTEATPEPLGDDVLLWAGENAIAFGAPPAEYDPASNQWTPLSPPPGAKRALSAIWTGSQAFVEVEIGGSDLIIVGFMALDPATGDWTELPVENAPPIAWFRPLVWTGGEVFLWGMTEVIETGEHEISGKRYNPASGTWRDVASTGAPSLRTDHSVTWTGNEAVVWGGTSDNDVVAPGTGGRYYPDRDAWEPVSLEGAPLGRRLHQAVEARGKVALWGGNGAEDYLADGGLYDPASDTWSTITTQCGPPPLLAPTLTWTGEELVLWGGLCAEPDCDERERIWTLDAEALFAELPPDDAGCECRTLEGRAQ